MDPYPDWAELPKDLLDSVLGKLDLLKDYLRFSIVCKSWYGIAKDNQKKRSIHPPPMLLINTDNVEDTWKVYNVMEDKLLDLELRLPNTRFCGSSKGWLVFVENKNFAVTLLNPFHKVRGRKENQNSLIHLPPLLSLQRIQWEKYENFVYKATISADPIHNPNDCIVVVITQPCGILAFIRLGRDKAWTYMDGRKRGRGFEEVVFLKDKVYGVQNNSRLLSFEIGADFNSDYKLAAYSLPPETYIRRYIVYSDEKKLFMVLRYISFNKERRRITDKFEVYQLNFSIRKWIEKHTLDDLALFLGDNSSFFVASSSFPGCLPNCIYCTHDKDSMSFAFGEDFGIYDFEHKRFLLIDTTYVSRLVKMSSQPAIWIMPTFHI